MQQSLRRIQRVFLNPTSLPGLRSPRVRVQSRDFYNAGRFPRASTHVGVGRNDGALGKWRGVRRESTETGEDKSGHISARANEGILFFDSEWFCSLFYIFDNWAIS